MAMATFPIYRHLLCISDSIFILQITVHFDDSTSTRIHQMDSKLVHITSCLVSLAGRMVVQHGLRHGLVVRKDVTMLHLLLRSDGTKHTWT